MLIRRLDLDSIYNLGHDAIALPRRHYSRLMDALQTLEWTNDPNGTFARIPRYLVQSAGLKASNKSEQELVMNQSAMNACPEELLEASAALLMDTDVMGNWIIPHRPELQFISIWDGAEDLDWHWDGPAGADFFFLIYLNQEMGWKDHQGGQLMVGKRSVNGNFMKVEPTEVQHLATYDPCSRTLICCNNQSPQFVHKVVPLTQGHERTVFMVGFNMKRFR